jgi:hypothetical protein
MTMERKINAITDCLELGNTEVVYELYLMYIKSKGIRQELYRFGDKGFNELFDTPSEAVKAIMGWGVQSYEEWDFMYINSSGDLELCDSVSEKANMTELANWLINECDIYEKLDVYDKLNYLDFPYNFIKEVGKNRSQWYRVTLSDWLEENNISSRELLDMDWDKIVADFENYHEQKLKKYYEDNPHLIK